MILYGSKLIKHSFIYKKTFFLAVVYFSPENSSKASDNINDLYSKLLNNIEFYSQLGEVVVQGDFNAYTGSTPDFVLSDNSPYPNYFIDSCIPRNSLDRKHPNKSRKLLTDLCKETGLRILNGRTLGDLHGKYTCITYNGCSVVDYTLVSSSLLQGIRSFMVNNLTPISDHCPISCSLLACFDNKTNKNKEKLDPLPGKFIWNEEAITRYKNNMSVEVKQKLQNFINHDYKDCSTAVEKLNSVLHDTALASVNLLSLVPKTLNRSKKKP